MKWCVEWAEVDRVQRLSQSAESRQAMVPDLLAALDWAMANEPDMALRAGPDGLDVVRRILAGAEDLLKPHGALFVEVGDSDERLQAAFPGVPFMWLEFEHGGGGVFMLTKHELERHRADLRGAD